MRKGPLPPLDATDAATVPPGKEEDLVLWSIRRNWEDLFQTTPHPGSETLQGVECTLIGSIEVWSTRDP